MIALLLALVLAALVVAAVAVVVSTTRGVAEVRRHVARWEALTETQAVHDIEIRWLRQTVNPHSQRARWPTPEHLQALPPAQHMEVPK